ncbi:metallophosphoesterase [candidate division KSB1 bacterium]|nr:metallophosphoesterase [candidate division KSB1 bacterium]
MPSSTLLIFFTSILSIYVLIHYYLLRHTLGALRGLSMHLRLGIAAVLVFFALLYPLSRTMAGVLLPGLSGWLLWMGAVYAGWLVYMLAGLVLRDLFQAVRLALHRIPKMPNMHPKTLVFLALLAAVIAALGWWNAAHPDIVRLDLTLSRSSALRYPLHLVVATDLHIDESVSPKRVQKWVSLINRQKADAVLLVGDILDGHQPHRLDSRFAESLRQLQSRTGVFAVPGNHEYYVGIDSALAFFRSAGITALRDTAVVIDEAFVLAGRDDRTRSSFGQARKRISELLKNIDPALPIIVLDHQPFDLNEIVTAQVDLQVSGHTHHGQLVPFNWITGQMYEKSWGLLKKNATFIYVSSGLGTWGPPMRLGNRPEIVSIRVNPKPASDET